MTTKSFKKERLFDALMEEPYEFDGLKCVSITNDTSYRHGVYQTAVFEDVESNEYWEVTFSVSGDGEQHELRDNDYIETINATKVVPKKVTEIVYVKSS